MTRVIVCGSREIISAKLVFNAIDKFRATRPITTIISGGARGVDSIAKSYALHHGVEFVEMKADWRAYGRAAGYQRNAEMLKALGNGGAIVAVWDGQSKGTKHMVDIARKGGYEVVIEVVAIRTGVK